MAFVPTFHVVLTDSTHLVNGVEDGDDHVSDRLALVVECDLVEIAHLGLNQEKEESLLFVNRRRGDQEVAL